MFNLEVGAQHLGYVWPILFITVACGAISGFHALVAGGTTCQAGEFRKAGRAHRRVRRHVPRGAPGRSWSSSPSAAASSYDQLCTIVFPADAAVKSNPVLAFALGVGGLLNKSVGLPMVYGTVFGILMVEGFVVTTLDTAVRLNRYLFEELWRMIFKKVPKILNTYIFNSLLCVVLMFVLAYFNAFKQLWNLFGAANQLLAALSLITVSIWLLKKGKKYLFALIPGAFHAGDHHRLARRDTGEGIYSERELDAFSRRYHSPLPVGGGCRYEHQAVCPEQKGSEERHNRRIS